MSNGESAEGSRKKCNRHGPERRPSKNKSEESEGKRNNPPVPQEILDEIIDNLCAEDHDTRTGSSILSCALASHAFLPRSRTHLFSSLKLTDRKLSTLDKDLTSDPIGLLHPQLGSLVRSLYIEGIIDDPAAKAYISLLRILPSFTCLSDLQITTYTDSDGNAVSWPDPELVKELVQFHEDCGSSSQLDGSSFFKTLSSLRSLTLHGLRIKDALELESVLVRATALKELTLSVRFVERGASVASHDARASVVLDSLKIVGMDIQDINEMVTSFIALDIKHLHSLDMQDSDGHMLLTTNSPTIKKLRLSLSFMSKPNWSELNAIVSSPMLNHGRIEYSLYDVHNAPTVSEIRGWLPSAKTPSVLLQVLVQQHRVVIEW
ncbi:hypothetical protein B0H14DRAFT_2727153 [Mycena olivaceomarginata]|nr:hypothetical protein B0H14DRAFT_2727153 [Mycena olivaceomarginata]